MHDFFHIRTVIISQLISIIHIHISLVSVCEVNFVLFNSMLKYVIYIIVTDMEVNIRIDRLPKGRDTDQWK